MSHIAQFNETRSLDIDIVGGKAASLARMAQANFPVPPGFTITTAAYAAFISENNLAKKIASIASDLDYDNFDDLEQRAKDIRALVENGTFPTGLQSSIEQCYLALGDDIRVAVRSSATAEDLPDASFAGQHDTYLDVKTVDAIVDATKRCWASMWTARATSYRHTQRIDHFDVDVAVVIQQMVDSDVSGVVFTANPLTTATDETVINASWGLGEAIVASLVTPDSYIVRHKNLRVREKTLGSKKVKTVRNPETGIGTVEIEVEDSDQNQFCLTDRQASELAELCSRVMEYYGGFPQDLEFGIAAGQIYLLQSRQITGVEFTWDEELNYWHVIPEGEDLTLTRSMSDEVWHGAITPLFYTTRGKMLHDAHAATHKMWGLESQNYRYYKAWKAGAYYDVRIEASDVTHMCPPPMRHMVIQHVAPPDRQRVLDAPFSYLKLAHRIYRNGRMFPEYGMYGWVKMLKNYVYERLDDARGLPDKALQKLSDADLISHTMERVKFEHQYIIDVWNGFFFNMRLMMLTLAYMVQHWYDGDNDMAATDLLTGAQRRSATVIENGTLWDLSKTIRRSTQLLKDFNENTDGDFLRALEKHDEGLAWLSRYNEFLAKSGHRGHADRDFYFKRRVEDPGLDYRAFQSFLTVDESHDPEHLEGESNKRREAAYADVLESIRRKPFGFLKAKAFKHVYSYVQTMLWLRDDHRDYVDIATFTYKRCFLEINRRLIERGMFDTERDFWFLAERDIYALLEGAELTPLMKAKITARMATFDVADRREASPPMYMKNNLAVSFEEEETGDGLLGVGMSKGVITGPARIVKELKDIGKVQHGDIMIVFATDPGWTPVFLVISGLIIETGGLLSHGASISREYGIPAVQLQGAMQRIPDGATITIDGTSGAIRIDDGELASESQPDAAIEAAD
ncbi:MAG: phosphohistidine swiveling domain-containing protein [Gammaproteobacteria bacterium]|jgi:phosphohistidine swiveling domain-containing protein